MVKKIFSHSLIYAIGPQLPKVIGLFLLPLLTPHLSKTDFGIWGTVTAYGLIFSAARDLGLVVPMFNSYYKNQHHWTWVWRQIMWYLLLWGILVAIVQSILLYYFIPTEADSYKGQIIVLLAVQCLFFDVPVIIGSRYFQVAEKPVFISIVSIISGLVAVASQYYFIVVLKFGFMGWFYASFISMATMAILYGMYLCRLRLFPLLIIRKNFAVARFRVALPIVPHNYSAYLLSASDRVMLSLFKIPLHQVGLYNVAYLWGNYADMLGNAVGMAVGPIYLKLYKLQEVGFLKTRQITIFLQVIFISGSFVISIWSKEFFSFFIKNKDLLEAYPLAIIIIMGYSYRPLYWNVVNKMQFDENTSKLWRITFLAGLINIFMNLICIPVFGYKAAAYTTFIAMMYQGFAGYFIKNLDVSFNKLELVLWFTSIVGATAIAYLLRDSSWMVKAMLSTITLILSSVVCIKISKHINLNE